MRERALVQDVDTAENSSLLERLALSEFTSHGRSVAEDLELIRRCGWTGIEFCENKLSTVDHQAREELAMLADSGLTVCSVQASVHAVFPDQMAEEPRDPQRRIDAFCRSMDRFADAAPEQRPVFVLISGRAPDHDLARARDTLAACAIRLAEEAEQRGFRIGFEPLNPILINEDTFLTAWDEALNLVECVGRDAFGLVCDLWNVWQQPDIESDVLGSIDRVHLVHVSDWRDGGPRRLNDRLVPGEGVIPLGAWGTVLRHGNYRGPICVELLSDEALDDSYLHRPMEDVLAASRDSLAAAGW